MRTLIAVDVLFLELVPPHRLCNLLTTLAECLDLAGERGIDVDGDRSLGQSTDGFVEICRDAGNKSHQVGQGLNQLLPDVMADAKKLYPVEKVGQRRGAAVEDTKSGHQGGGILAAQLYTTD